MRQNSALAATAVLILIAAASAWAAEGWDLTSSEVREAYFLGQRRGDERLEKFFKTYVKRLPAPASGPHVAVIELSTPYHQVVKRSWRAVTGYSSQQAARDYKADPDRVLVNVTVNLLPGDVAALRDVGFWQNFDARLVQHGQAIFPRRLDGELIYLNDGSGFGQVIGFELRAEFNTQQVARAPVSVEVITHDQQTVTAQFDLARLK